MNLVKLAEEYLGEKRLKALPREKKIDELVKELAKELAKQEKWDLLLQVFDQLEENSDRAYYGKQDFLSADEILTDEFLEDAFIPLEHILRLSCHDDWLDIIYSDSSDNLWQLAETSELMEGLKSLTVKQRETFYMKVIEGYTTTEISELLGTTDRNIRKHYSKAVEELKSILEPEKTDNILDSYSLLFLPRMELIK